MTVLRDGKVIDTLNVKDVDKKTLVRLMVGREVSEYMQHTANYSTEEVALKVENLTSDGVFENVSLSSNAAKYWAFLDLWAQSAQMW